MFNREKENTHTKLGQAQPRRAGASTHHPDSPSPCLQAASVPNVGTQEQVFGLEVR